MKGVSASRPSSVTENRASGYSTSSRRFNRLVVRWVDRLGRDYTDVFVNGLTLAEAVECKGERGRWQPSSDGRSRMTRAVNRRICERLGVRFPGRLGEMNHRPMS
jgi:hypothetical protein